MGGTGMKVTRIHHVSLNTDGSDLEEVRRFYTDLLGLEMAPRPDFPVPGYWLEAGPGGQVHLIGGPARDDVIDPMAPHHCFAVDDFEGALAELEAAGHEVLRFGDQAWVRDPAGHIVELQQDTPS
jgi:catechol 2,3-dioxygenase-like lactoylglutathione lyase family enzyme